jgi:hypothetical protein
MSKRYLMMRATPQSSSLLRIDQMVAEAGGAGVVSTGFVTLLRSVYRQIGSSMGKIVVIRSLSGRWQKARPQRFAGPERKGR